MNNDRELQKLIINYIDEEDEIDVEDIVKNVKHLSTFLQLLGKISFKHPHHNDPEKQAQKICEILEPFEDKIRYELRDTRENGMDFIEKFKAQREEILKKIDELQTKYSYYECKFEKNNDNDKRDMSFRNEYLLNVINEIEDDDYDDILYFLTDIERQFIDIINHERVQNNSNVNDEDWNTVSNDYEEYYWYDAYYCVKLTDVQEYPDGEKNSQFDTLHDLLMFLKGFCGYDNNCIDIHHYTGPVTYSVSYLSIPYFFRKNKRVLRYLRDKGFVVDDPILFDFELYREEIEEIIDYDDVERFVSYITVTNYDLHKHFPNYTTEYGLNWWSRHITVDMLCYVMMKGSYNIFKYLLRYYNLTQDHYTYAIQGGNAEIVHYIEDNVNIKFHSKYLDAARESYNFNIIEYINNTYSDTIFKWCVKYREDTKKWLLNNHMSDVLKKINDKMIKEDVFDNVFRRIANLGDKRFIPLLHTKYLDTIVNIINFDVFPDMVIKRRDIIGREYIDNSFDQNKLKICQYYREVLGFLYTHHYEFTVNIIKYEMYDTVFELLKQKDIVPIYKEIMKEYKEEYMESINYDIIGVYYG